MRLSFLQTVILSPLAQDLGVPGRSCRTLEESSLVPPPRSHARWGLSVPSFVVCSEDTEIIGYRPFPQGLLD